MSKLLIALFLAVVLAFPAAAQSSPRGKTGPVFMCWMTIKGAKQGPFKGDDPKENNYIACTAFDMTLLSPHDPATGQASGKRQWKPIVVTKEWGASSPQLLQAEATNEVLSQVVINFSRPGSPNRAEQFTVTLTDASIAEIQQVASLSNLSDVANTSVEKVSFTFRKIQVEEKLNKTIFTDDWSAR